MGFSKGELNGGFFTMSVYVLGFKPDKLLRFLFNISQQTLVEVLLESLSPYLYLSLHS